MARCPSIVAQLWGVLILAALLGCSAPEIDKSDELDEGPEADEYEWVIVEAEEGEAEIKSPPQKPPVAENAPVPAAQAPPSQPLMAPEDMPPDTGQPIRYDPKGDYTVQLAGYRSKKLADEQVAKLVGEGYPAYSVRSPDGAKYRVRIGYFSNRAEAELFGGLFKEDRGMDYWVDLRSKE